MATVNSETKKRSNTSVTLKTTNTRKKTRNAFEKGIQTSMKGCKSCANAHLLPSRNARVGEPTSLLSCLPWHVPPHVMALPSLSTDPPEGEQYRGDQDEHHRNVKIVHHRQPFCVPDRGSRSPFPVVLFLAKGGRARSSHAARLHRLGRVELSLHHSTLMCNGP